MNVERIFLWIRLVAEVILEVFDRIDQEPPGETGTPGIEMKPERIQLWLRILARAALQAIDGFGPISPEMKPERIQFWLQLVTRFVLAVFAAANEETGKSGDGPAHRTSTLERIDW